MIEFKRSILSTADSNQVAEHLQKRLVDLIDLTLILKQAHWQVVGTNFRAVHMQLDEIISDVRAGSDEVAERMSTLGVAPDGRASIVSETSTLSSFDYGFAKTPETVTAVADILLEAITGLRESIGLLAEIDPVSEDLLISIAAPLEQHLWMVQSQEA